jgi:ABC-type hemin transport system substrate-binding protein
MAAALLPALAVLAMLAALAATAGLFDAADAAADAAADRAAAAKTGGGRIITLAPHLAELVCDAGACDQLVAVSAYSDFPPELARLPRIGDGFSFNLESIVALHPDRVLAWEGGTPAATVQRLRALGLTVDWIRIVHLQDVPAALDRLGRLLHTPAAAAAAAARFSKRLAALQLRWQGRPPLRVVYQIGTGPAYTVGGASPISEALAVCGGVNAFAGLSSLAAPIGAEAMLAAQPQALLFGGDDRLAAIRAYWARLPGAPVNRLGTFYRVDADWLARPTPRMLDGIEQVCTDLDDARRRAAGSRVVPDRGAPVRSKAQQGPQLPAGR